MDTKESLPHTACGGDSFTAMDHGTLARTAFDLSDLTIWNNCLNLLELDKKFNTILYYAGVWMIAGVSRRCPHLCIYKKV